MTEGRSFSGRRSHPSSICSRGLPLAQGKFEVTMQATSELTNELGRGNLLTLSDEALLENLQAVQNRNEILQDILLDGRNFSVEMETGTGKTYVYLRTIFELHVRYGFTKFVIVVPSIAIREGVSDEYPSYERAFRSAL